MSFRTRHDGQVFPTDNVGISEFDFKSVDSLGNPVYEGYETGGIPESPSLADSIGAHYLFDKIKRTQEASRENGAIKKAAKQAMEDQKKKQEEEANKNLEMANQLLERAEAIKKGKPVPEVNINVNPEEVHGTKPQYLSEKEIEQQKKATAKESVKEEKIIAGMGEKPLDTNPLFRNGKPTAAYGRPPVEQTQSNSSESQKETPTQKSNSKISSEDKLLFFSAREL